MISHIFNKYKGTSVLLASLMSASPSFAEVIDVETDAKIKTSCSGVMNIPLVETKINVSDYIARMKEFSTFYKILEIKSSTHDKEIKAIKAATSNSKFIIHIQSIGGDTLGGIMYAKSIHNSTGTIMTAAVKEATSAASYLLFSGTPKNRWAHIRTKIIIHNPYTILNKRKYWQEDFNAGTDGYSIFNDNIEKQAALYTKLSSNKSITKKCLDALIRGKNDTLISTDFALKAGWVDYVWENNSSIYDLSVKIRAKMALLPDLQHGQP